MKTARTLISAGLFFMLAMPTSARTEAPATEHCAALYAHYTSEMLTRMPEEGGRLVFDYELRAQAATALYAAQGETKQEQAASEPRRITRSTRYQDWVDLHRCDQALGFQPVTPSDGVVPLERKAELKPDNLTCGAMIALSASEFQNAEPGSADAKSLEAAQQTLNSLYAPLARAGISDTHQEQALIATMQGLNMRFSAEPGGNPHDLLTGPGEIGAFTKLCMARYPGQPMPEPVRSVAGADGGAVCTLIDRLTRSATRASPPFSNLSRTESGYGLYDVEQVFGDTYRCSVRDTDAVYGMDLGFTRLSCQSRETDVTPRDYAARDAVFAPARADRDRLNRSVKACLPADRWRYGAPDVDLNYGTSWEDHVYTHRTTGVTLRIRARRGDDPDALRYGRSSKGYVHRHGFAVDTPPE